MQQTLKADLGLTGSYVVLSSGAKAASEDLSPSGNPDADGLTNLQEYQNAVAHGGTEADYVTAALNPLLDGNPATAEATNPCEPPSAREIITWRVAQKHYFNTTFGGALAPGRPDQGCGVVDEGTLSQRNGSFPAMSLISMPKSIQNQSMPALP